MKHELISTKPWGQQTWAEKNISVAKKGGKLGLYTWGVHFIDKLIGHEMCELSFRKLPLHMAAFSLIGVTGFNAYHTLSLFASRGMNKKEPASKINASIFPKNKK